jgi:inner membrane transporter RhtA
VNPIAVSILSVLVAITSIQVGATLAKSIFPVVGAGGATALRLIFASLILCSVWRPWRKKLKRNELKSILVYGASLGAMNLTFYLALARIPLGIAVALEFTGPLTVALLASRRALDFVWAALAAAGILLILPLSEASGGLDWLGALLALCAGLFWALYIVFGQRAGSSVHGGTATSLGMFFAAMVAVPIGVAQAGSMLLNTAVLPSAIGVAVLSSAVPYSLEMNALKRLPKHTFGILMSLEPAVAALSGLVFLHEALRPAQWLALVCIISASAGSAATAKPKQPVAIAVN